MSKNIGKKSLGILLYQLQTKQAQCEFLRKRGIIFNNIASHRGWELEPTMPYADFHDVTPLQKPLHSGRYSITEGLCGCYF